MTKILIKKKRYQHLSIEQKEEYLNRYYQLGPTAAASYLMMIELTPLFYGLAIGEASLKIMYSGLRKTRLLK